MSTTNLSSTALTEYSIPQEHPNFLYMLPALYVGMSDGSLSIKEACSVGFNADEVMNISTDGDALGNWLKIVIPQLVADPRLDGIDMVADAINELLATESPRLANQVREGIHSMCTKVAKASGPLFRDKVSTEERAMLDKIFAKIEA